MLERRMNFWKKHLTYFDNNMLDKILKEERKRDPDPKEAINKTILNLPLIELTKLDLVGLFKRSGFIEEMRLKQKKWTIEKRKRAIELDFMCEDLKQEDNYG